MTPAPVWRIRDRATFAALRTEGHRIRRGPLSVRWLPGTSPPRVAFAVSRSVGSAVVRNRIRRRLRAVVRELAAELTPGAYLIHAGREVATMRFEDLRAIVAEVLCDLTSEGRR